MKKLNKSKSRVRIGTPPNVSGRRNSLISISEIGLSWRKINHVKISTQLRHKSSLKVSLPKNIHEAIGYLDDFLIIFPNHTEAQAMGILLDSK